MSKQPLVSIVIPNYNYERYLTERFCSILEQSFGDYEIIFLDDASTDESVSLVRERFSGHVAHIEINETNSGNPFVQWNRGVRLSASEYVWIAEADDVCTPNFLECMIGVMSRNPSVGLAYCNTTPIDGNGIVIDSDYYLNYVSDLDPSRWLSDFTEKGSEEVRRYLARKNTITNVSGVLFRRNAYLKAGCAPENFRMCGDWMTYCRVLRETDVAYVNAQLNFHRQHPAKHTQNSVLDLTYFREFLEVQKYVAQAFGFTKNDQRAALHRFLCEWDRLTVSNYGCIDLYRTLTLAKITAKFYPGLLSYTEIATHLLLNSCKSLVGTWLRK